VLRLEGSLQYPSLSHQGRYLAFTNEAGSALRVLNLGSQDVVEVSTGKVGSSFFWAPDGARLFFRELVRDGTKLVSRIKVFDALSQKIDEVQSFEGSSGLLSFDPRSYKFYLIHEKGLYQQQLEYPTRSRPKWTQKATLNFVAWIGSQKAMLRLKDNGLTWETLPDDGSGLQSFAISPDGQTVVWATKEQRLFQAQAADEKPRYLGRGRDPSWHPYRALLVYASARMIGPRIYDYDLRLMDNKGEGRFLLQTATLSERWPIWFDADTLLYTADSATDLLRLSLQKKSVSEASFSPVASARGSAP
jgi:Tol biopolymer transport system component